MIFLKIQLRVINQILFLHYILYIMEENMQNSLSFKAIEKEDSTGVPQKYDSTVSVIYHVIYSAIYLP